MTTCKKCGRDLPPEAYYVRISKSICYDCVKARQAEYARSKIVMERSAELHRIRRERIAMEQEKEQEKAKAKANVNTCKKDCLRYPCFQGIDNLKTNFALTCVKFNKR